MLLRWSVSVRHSDISARSMKTTVCAEGALSLWTTRHVGVRYPAQVYLYIVVLFSLSCNEPKYAILATTGAPTRFRAPKTNHTRLPEFIPGFNCTSWRERLEFLFEVNNVKDTGK